MKTAQAARWARSLGLMHALDRVKFHYQWAKNRRANADFLRRHPGLALPPDYMMFEAFGLIYENYYSGGLETARWLKETLDPHLAFDGINLLDWGCGPARIVRHLPALLRGRCNIFATDYNPSTIGWCAKNIPEVQFSVNEIDPPLKYPGGFFGLVYGISIFTHLSLENHGRWFGELMRVLRPGGIVLLTTHGEIFKEKMTGPEIREFDHGNLVIRGGVKEGHRVFTAFHPPAYARNLFEPAADILSHTPGGREPWGLAQDLWILKKN